MRVHVLPRNDLIEHEEIGDGCVCGPDWLESGALIVHHSLDGRELTEEAS